MRFTHCVTPHAFWSETGSYQAKRKSWTTTAVIADTIVCCVCTELPTRPCAHLPTTAYDAYKQGIVGAQAVHGFKDEGGKVPVFSQGRG
jgi:hypothetical protein